MCKGAGPILGSQQLIDPKRWTPNLQPQKSDICKDYKFDLLHNWHQVFNLKFDLLKEKEKVSTGLVMNSIGKSIDPWKPPFETGLVCAEVPDRVASKLAKYAKTCRIIFLFVHVKSL